MLQILLHCPDLPDDLKPATRSVKQATTIELEHTILVTVSMNMSDVSVMVFTDNYKLTYEVI